MNFTLLPSPPLFLPSLSPHFLSPTISPLYLSPICNSLLPRLYLCLPLTRSSSQLSFSFPCSSLFPPLVVFHFFFHCQPLSQGILSQPIHTGLFTLRQRSGYSVKLAVIGRHSSKPLTAVTTFTYALKFCRVCTHSPASCLRHLRSLCLSV